MALSAGARLGPHEILAPLGTGEMGEVYRANGTRVDRTVGRGGFPRQARPVTCAGGGPPIEPVADSSRVGAAPREGRDREDAT